MLQVLSRPRDAQDGETLYINLDQVVHVAVSKMSTDYTLVRMSDGTRLRIEMPLGILLEHLGHSSMEADDLEDDDEDDLDEFESNDGDDVD